ncbi:hypothetical protein C1H46_014112 [Malus baccata]|uniref:HMA domain-containing protein n=1 Tax=Malus baccata TaxID=106549 RepID=A0A540MPG6_MALBA|nr:hypothetical protein C1H46_014112 [Malus baccata]
MASQTTTVLKVGMSCQGCVGAVKRVLGKLEALYTGYHFGVLQKKKEEIGHDSYVLELGVYFTLGVDAMKIMRVPVGVESYDIDFDAQKVTVKSNLPSETVLQTVSKTGKKTAYWEAEAPAPAEPEAKPAETVAAA